MLYCWYGLLIKLAALFQLKMSIDSKSRIIMPIFTIALCWAAVFSITITDGVVVIVQPPANASVLIGETAVFTCEAEGSSSIDYIINGSLSAASFEAQNLGYKQSDIMINGTKMTRSLSVKCGFVHNAFIYCRAINITSYDVQLSKPAKLTVKKVYIYERPVYDNVTSTKVGDHSRFKCVARAKNIDFLINGLSAAAVENTSNEKFSQSLISSYLPTTHDGIIQRTLYVTSTIENSNSYILCRATGGSSVDIKLLTLLKVRGPFSINESNAIIPLGKIMSSSDDVSSHVKVQILGIHPKSDVAVLQGKNITFSCTALVPQFALSSLIFFIDDKTAALVDYRDRFKMYGFDEANTTQPENGTIVQTNLLALGKPQNNNTKIKCVAAYTSLMNDKDNISAKNMDISKQILFQVQGPLGPVHHLFVHWDPLNTIANISWDAPDTLHGVSILGYNISFDSLETEKADELDYPIFREELFYYPYVWNMSCTEMTILAYNGLNGTNITRLLVPPPYVTVGQIVNLANGSVNISLNLNISVSVVCWEQFLKLIEVNIFFLNGTHFNNFENVQLSSVTNVILNSSYITLKAHEQYTIGEVKYSDINGDHHFGSLISNFTTDPSLTIKLIQLQPRLDHDFESTGDYHGTIEFKCEFSLKAMNNTHGCLIQLFSKSNSSIHFGNKTVTTTEADNEVTVYIPVQIKPRDEKFLLKGYIIDTTGSEVFAFFDDNFEVSSDTYQPHHHTPNVWKIVSISLALIFGLALIVLLIKGIVNRCRKNRLRNYIPRQVIPGQDIPGQVIPGQDIPGQVIPGQDIPGQVIPGQVIPGQVIPGQDIPGQGIPGQDIPGQGIPGQGVPGQGIPGQGIPGQGIPGQSPDNP